MICLLFLVSVQIVNSLQLSTSNLTEANTKIIEYVVFGLFTVDMIFRFIICPKKLKFFIDPFNIVDFISILPSYVFIAIINTTSKSTLIRYDRMIKSLIILKLFRYIPSMRILISALVKSWKELGKSNLNYLYF